ncbi:MAG: Gfo/Idh/MocA family protein [Candidatus Hodarchaeota archaeon]
MKNVNIGIASFAHMHAYSYLNVLLNLESVDVVGFCDLNQDRKKKIKNDYNIPSFPTYEKLAEQSDIDVILITTETVNHVHVAIAALENGKHVIIEKPIATTLEDAELMINTAKKHGMKLFQCYPCRYHPSAQRVKQLAEKNQLGEILGITATNHGCMPNHRNPEFQWFSDKELAGGGAVMDHTTHAADLIFWFTGWTPKSIYGVAKRLFNDEINSDDAGMVLMNFSNEKAASIDPSWSRPVSFPTWGDLNMMIYGSERTVMVDMFNQNFEIYSRSKSGKTATWQPFGSDIDYVMLKSYMNALVGDENPPVTGMDGLKALKVALKAYESNEKKEVVEW